MRFYIKIADKKPILGGFTIYDYMIKILNNKR